MFKSLHVKEGKSIFVNTKQIYIYENCIEIHSEIINSTYNVSKY